MPDNPISEGSLTLVLGGARSGKSTYAEGLVARLQPPWRYVATAQAWDAEMAERIALHRARRDGGWQTSEVPLALSAFLAAHRDGPLLIDCLTLWLSNHLLAGSDLTKEMDDLEAAVAGRIGPTVAVANEVGLGIVPDNALGRRFRDEAGRLNQRLAAGAATVLFMVAGLPMVVKDSAGGAR